jgi:ABC-type nickel/cobalt efflux system permease component RcnA
MSKETDENFSYRASLEDIKANYLRQSDRMMMSRDIAKTILTSATVIVSVLGAFTAYRNETVSFSPFQLIFIITAALLFTVLVLICVYLLLPAPFMGPIKADQETYETQVFGKNEQDTLLILFSAYLNVVNLNARTIETRNTWTKIAGVLLVLLVGCLMLFIILK